MQSPVRQQNRTIKALEWLKVVWCVSVIPASCLILLVDLRSEDQRGDGHTLEVFQLSLQRKRENSESEAESGEACKGGFTHFDRGEQAVENTHSQSKRLGGKLERAAHVTHPHNHLVVLSWADI